MPQASERHNAGFTIIEALVVVAVTALISGLAFPRLESLVTQQSFRTVHSHILLDLNNSRATAVRTGQPVHILLRPDGADYSINGQASNKLPQNTFLRGLGRMDIWFFADGTSTGGRLVLAGDHLSAHYTIATSGRISGAMP